MGIRGRAWGNALGGWRLQGRGPRGKFLKKGAPSYRPSRSMVAEQNRRKQQQALGRRKRAVKVAKTAAIVGGTALAVGATVYGANRVNASQTQTFYARQGARMARSAGAGLAGATSVKAGSIGTVRLSPRAPIGLKGFSRASATSHHLNTLLPPVGHLTNTRRPASYRYHGEALRKTIQVDMNGKELLSRAEVLKQNRSFSSRKGAWKKRANKNLADKARKAAEKATEVKQAKASTAPKKSEAVQNPTPPKKKTAPTKASTPATKTSKSAPKSKNVVAPQAAVTTSDVAPSKPATGKGSSKAKNSPAKSAATGGGKKTTEAALAAMPESTKRDFYEDNYAPAEDSDEVRLSGGVMSGVDQYGESVVIPIAGRKPSRAGKPTGARPGAPRKNGPAKPMAANQPRPQETVQREATKAAKNEDNVPDNVRTIMDPTRMKILDKADPSHGNAWYTKVFSVKALQDMAALGYDKTQTAQFARTIGYSKEDAATVARAVGDYRKANKRSKTTRNEITGKKMGKDERRAATLAGDIVVTTKGDSARIAAINDKMAKGKAQFNEGEVKQAMALLKGMAGMHAFTGDMLWKEATGPNRNDYSAAERKAMRLVSNWKNTIGQGK